MILSTKKPEVYLFLFYTLLLGEKGGWGKLSLKNIYNAYLPLEREKGESHLFSLS